LVIETANPLLESFRGILKKFFKRQKSINVALFHKDVAPGKILKN
jgi:hypothetical protein